MPDNLWCYWNISVIILQGVSFIAERLCLVLLPSFFIRFCWTKFSFKGPWNGRIKPQASKYRLYKKILNRVQYLIYRVFFLFRNHFNSLSCLHFSSDFVDRYINLFTLLCAIEWGVDHNSIIPMCGVTSQYVKAVIFWKTDFS